MHLLNLFSHTSLVAVSCVASIIGLVLLWDFSEQPSDRQKRKQQKDEVEQTEQILFRMCFSYWLVYCIAFGIQKLILPDWEALMMSLRITTALSYFLTFSCIVSLPLHKLAVRRIQE